MAKAEVGIALMAYFLRGFVRIPLYNREGTRVLVVLHYEPVTQVQSVQISNDTLQT